MTEKSMLMEQKCKDLLVLMRLNESCLRTTAITYCRRPCFTLNSPSHSCRSSHRTKVGRILGRITLLGIALLMLLDVSYTRQLQRPRAPHVDFICPSGSL